MGKLRWIPPPSPPVHYLQLLLPHIVFYTTITKTYWVFQIGQENMMNLCVWVYLCKKRRLHIMFRYTWDANSHHLLFQRSFPSWFQDSANSPVTPTADFSRVTPFQSSQLVQRQCIAIVVRCLQCKGLESIGPSSDLTPMPQPFLVQSLHPDLSVHLNLSNFYLHNYI